MGVMRSLRLWKLLIGLLLTLLASAAGAQATQTTDGVKPKVRLNRLVELWEQGKPVFGTFARFRDADGATYYGSSQLDFVLFDMEHATADFTQLRTFMQFLVNRGRLVEKGNLQPDVVPLARIPPNGAERNQWVIKQVLDLGTFGLMAPHIANAQEARHLVAASRYPQRIAARDDNPGGERGVSPGAAARYWGLPVVEYMERADVWPLDPEGELLVIAMIEDVEGVKNARSILQDAKGIGAVFLGPFDLSTSLGYPAQPDHPEVEKAIQQVLAVTKELNIPCGVLTTLSNVERRLKEGFRFIVLTGTPGEVEEAVKIGRRLSGR